MIGDPKDSGERSLNTAETVVEWTERVRRQVSAFVSFEGVNAATLVNNQFQGKGWVATAIDGAHWTLVLVIEAVVIMLLV